MRHYFLDIMLVVLCAVPEKLPGTTCGEEQIPLHCNPPPMVPGFSFSNHLFTGSTVVSLVTADLVGDGSRYYLWAEEFPEYVSVLGPAGAALQGEPVRYEVALNPWRVHAADLNGDLSLDLVIACVQEFSILLNKGDGTFENALDYLLWDDPIAVDSADFDLDGDKDIVFAVDQGLYLVMNDGSGTFERYGEIPVYPRITAMALGDMDDDGDPDIVFAQQATPSVSILYNDSGSFGKTEAFPVSGFPVYLGLADLDGAGRLDAAMTMGSRFAVLSVLRNEGDGLLGDAASYPRGGSGGPFGVEDFDGDGDLDIGMVDEPGASLWVNRGDAVYLRSMDIDIPMRPLCMAAVDADGDGDIDMVSGNDLTGGLAVVANTPTRDSADCNGNGTADECELEDNDCDRNCIPDDCDSSPTAVLNETRLVHPEALGRTRLAEGDFDGDGDVDIATQTREILLNNGTGTFTGTITGYGDLPLSQTAVGDFDGDGDPDLAIGAGDSLTMLRSHSSGRFGPGSSLGIRNIDSIAAADLDGDGDLDIAASTPANTTGSAIAFLNAGSGGFAMGAQAPLGTGPYTMVAADLDGDGDADLATANRGTTAIPGTASLAMNRGDATFQPAEDLETGVFPVSISAGDIDGDRDLDLVTADGASSTLSLLLNGGTGAFERSALATPPYPAGAAMGDVDGDEDLDIVVSGQGGFETTVLVRNQGNGTFARPLPVPLFNTSSSLSLVDVTGDGRPELLADVDSEHAPSIYLLNESVPPRSVDRDENGVLDRCETPSFHRGDSEADGTLLITDAVRILGFLFGVGVEPGCLNAADANGDDGLDISDPVTILNYLFVGGRPPPEPGPPGQPCGTDDDPPNSPGDLGCSSYDPCS